MSIDGQQPHIVCIDHAPEILDLLRTLLEDEGYRVSTLHAIDRSLDIIVDLNPDVITIDYMWASSDNEWTFLNLLTMDPRTRNIPVILCTGAVKRVLEMESHLNSIGIKVVLKPFDIDVLQSAVRSCLEREHTADRSIVPPNA